MATFPITATVISSQEFSKGKFLGKGSFGSVYLGKWYNTSIAIKELFVQSNVVTKEFEREAGVMAQCNHPNIVRLFGVCIEEGKLALLMEYLEKGSLYDLLIDVKIILSWARRYVRVHGYCT
jgi:serine/threonine protein kinase